jgi:hypothetical protein
MTLAQFRKTGRLAKVMGARVYPRPLVYHSEPFADSSPRLVGAKNEKGEASSLPYTGRTVTENV